MATFESINPADESLIESYEEISQSELREIIERSHHSFLEWRLLYLYTRAKYLMKVSQVIREKKGELARLVTIEMGKPTAQAEAEVEKCAVLAEYYAHNGPLFLEDRPVETEATKSYVTFQPLGIILGIMPWNFPLWQVFRFALPTVMAGNAVLLKHSPNVSGCALAIEKIFEESGFPDGIFKTILVDVDKVPYIMEHDYVQGVSLTGSERAGRIVGELAGRNLKPAVLELGGSDPYIIFQDADLEAAVETCVTSRLVNCGQTCISAKRFLVQKEIFGEFSEMFAAKMAAMQLGNPLEGADMGPMARKDLRDELHKQVQASKREGAKVLTGGEVPDGKGYFYPATVMTDVTPDMTVWKEETFGPVAAVVPFGTELEAVRLANDTPYGLGAALFSRDVERMEKLAKYKIIAGSVYINDFVKSDARLPFGGVKASGFGRELSEYGILAFANIKTIVAK